jgi:hypothetical protein
MASREWIEKLTQDLKQKNREAAEEFGRAQHRSDVIASEGRLFFGDMARAIDDNFTLIRRQLQGDPASADLAMISTGATAVHLTRARFPWFDAHVTHEGDLITLDYARDPAYPGDPSLVERTRRVFHFHVDPADRLSVEDSFGDTPQSYAAPEDLARRITEILFEG